MLDLKAQQQEKDSLQTKATGDLDIIAQLKNEVSEIQQQRSSDITKLENEIDEIKQREVSLLESKEFAIQEAKNLSSKVQTLEINENDMKLVQQKLENEVEKLRHIK
jgi:hypothetical protein